MTRPLAVLVNSGSASSADFLPLIVHTTGRGKTFGAASSGAFGQPVPDDGAVRVDAGQQRHPVQRHGREPPPGPPARARLPRHLHRRRHPPGRRHRRGGGPRVGRRPVAQRAQALDARPPGPRAARSGAPRAARSGAPRASRRREKGHRAPVQGVGSSWAGRGGNTPDYRYAASRFWGAGDGPQAAHAAAENQPIVARTYLRAGLDARR